MTRTLTPAIAAASALFSLMLILPGVILAADLEDEDRLYQIELIVFENKVSVDSTELLPRDPGQVELNQAMELLKQRPVEIKRQPTQADLVEPPSLSATRAESPQAPPPYQDYELLPDELLTLTDSLERLKASTDYQPLLHIGWRQPVPERDNAQTVAIDSRKLLLHMARFETADAAADLSTAQGDPSSAAVTYSAMPPESLYDQGPNEILTQINENFVNGTLSLTRGRYLHMSLDLLYQRQPNAPQLFSFFGFSNAGNSPEIYRLTQTRRLKRGEIHYFDHPKFGVIAVVTAVEDQEPDQVQTIPLNRRR